MWSASDSRPTVIRPFALVGLASIVATVFVLLFPGLDFARAKLRAPADELSIAYLKQVLRQEPGDDDARLLLARQQLRLGHWDDAEQTLRPALDSKKPTRLAIRVAWMELARDRLDAVPIEHPDRRQRQREAVAAVRLLESQALDTTDLESLARTALALEIPGDAADLYERLAAADPTRGWTWRAHAGRWHQAANRLDASARAYLAASAAAPDESHSVDALLNAVAVLQAGNRGGDALVAVEAGLARWPRANRLEDRGVALALATGDLARAETWGQLLISQGHDVASRDGGHGVGADADRLLEKGPWEGPSNPPRDGARGPSPPAPTRLLARQLDIELQVGNLTAALAVVHDLIQLRPDDADLRRRQAQIATWAGRPRLALTAWAWLAAHGCGGCRTDALKLAHALYDYEGVSDLLKAKARAETLTIDELLDLTDALQNEGEPAEARRVLSASESTFAGVRPYWQERAEVDEHADDLPGALRDEREIERRFGAETTHVKRQAELLWKLGRPSDALDLLRKAAPQVGSDALTFWRLMADLAWTLEDDVDAELAYRRVWAIEKQDLTTAERLVSLASARGDRDEVMRVGREGFERFAAPSLLVAAVDAAVETERWDTAHALVAEGASKHADVSDQATYWSSVGQLATHDGNVPQAVKAFTRAETLDPTEPGLHEDLRWARIDAGLDRDPDDVPGGPDDGDDASARLDAAIHNHDHAAVRAILDDPRADLSPSERVEAARELGDDARAWALVNAAPHAADDPDENASLALDWDELATRRLGGAWASMNAQSLGDVSLLGEDARSEVRVGDTRVGVRAGHVHLIGGGTLVAPGFAADEWRAGGSALWRQSVGETRVEAGGQFLPSGALPYATALQTFEPRDWLSLRIEAAYHALPTDTAALRVAGLRDAVEAESELHVGAAYLVETAVDAHHYEDRTGDSLANGVMARVALARILRAAHPIVRIRVDGNLEINRLASALPADLVPMFVADTDVSDVVPATHGTTGIGITLLDRDDNDLGSAEGCVRCLRPFADLWAGWLMPYQRVTYSAEAGLGLVFARWQELAATAFYFSDRGGEPGQRYAGANLSYVLRWL